MGGESLPLAHTPLFATLSSGGHPRNTPEFVFGVTPPENWTKTVFLPSQQPLADFFHRVLTFGN